MTVDHAIDANVEFIASFKADGLPALAEALAEGAIVCVVIVRGEPCP